MALGNTPQPKVGCEEFWFAPLLTDIAGAEKPTYGPAVRVPGLTQFGFNPNAQSASFYADNGVYSTATQNGDLTLTVGMAQVTPEIRAIWFGQDYKKGLLEEGQINPIEMAVGAKTTFPDGSSAYAWYYKAKAAPPAESANTKGNSISFQSDSITINCASLVSTGKYRRLLIDSDKNLAETLTPEAIAANWFVDPIWDLIPVA